MRLRTALYAVCFISICCRSGHGLLENLPEQAIHRLLFQEPNDMLQQLSKISDDNSSLVRTYLSPAHVKAAEQLREWMGHAGLATTVDGLGNVRGRAEGSVAEPTVFTGSHYDTVIDGGNYDGSLGIISGIAAIKAILLDAAIGKGLLSSDQVLELPQDVTGKLIVPPSVRNTTLLGHSIEVVGFADEEGVRFQSTYLGSRALSGGLEASGALDSCDASGLSLRELLEKRGITDPSTLAIKNGSARAYVEVHMEQGPVLEATRTRLAAVSGIAGQTRLAATIRGEQGHAGTVPMQLRHDPMPAAAEAIVALEKACTVSNGEASPTGLVCTVGTLNVWPGAGNVIPGSVQLSMDIRSQSDEERHSIVDGITQEIKDLCKTRGLNCTVEVPHQAPAVLADVDIVKKLSRAIQDSVSTVERIVGEENDNDQTCAAPETCSPSSIGPLVSGAGHDAAEMAFVAPMGMIFVRCKAGISHSPLEYVAPGDVAAGTTALAAFLSSELAAA